MHLALVAVVTLCWAVALGAVGRRYAGWPAERLRWQAAGAVAWLVNVAIILLGAGG